jgi:hypothetical protein
METAIPAEGVALYKNWPKMKAGWNEVRKHGVFYVLPAGPSWQTVVKC